MNYESNQYAKQSICQKCSQKTENLIVLSCRHSFCLKCAAFSYHKYKLAMNKPNLTKCLKCQKITDLNEEDLKSINQFTDHVLMPLMREQQENKNGKNRTNNPLASYIQLTSCNKQFKSYEQSAQKVTPLAGRGFNSKCESPKSGINLSFCQLHPQQQLNIVCLSCQNTLLCISCISNKRHNNHNIKTIAKGWDSIQQQISIIKLRGKQHVESLQVLKHRLEDRRTVIQERWDRTTESLQLHFTSLIEMINKKCDQISRNYSQFFQSLMQEVIRDGAKVDETMKLINRHLQKLTDVSKGTHNNIESIRKSTQLMEEIKDLRQPDIDVGHIPSCDSQRITRQINKIIQKIERIYFNQREGHRAFQTSKSEERLLKQNYKRIKTNMISLNSSRDKREKKFTKTEEDEKRNKSKANYKTESTSKLLKVNKSLPGYLLQHLDKQNKDFANFPECLADLNPLQSSIKSTSKLLSKSQVPIKNDQIKKKKDQHVAQIKQRLERKTFNGSSKQLKINSDGMRKKKIPV